MKKQANSFKTWVTWQLRRLSYRWPARSAAFRRAAVTEAEYRRHPGIKNLSKRIRNFYCCQLCKLIFDRKHVSADHLYPVIDPKRGFRGWDEYIPRLFCDESGFQILCSDCHDEKTTRERQLRKQYKRKVDKQ